VDIMAAYTAQEWLSNQVTKPGSLLRRTAAFASLGLVASQLVAPPAYRRDAVSSSAVLLQQTMRDDLLISSADVARLSVALAEHRAGLEACQNAPMAFEAVSPACRKAAAPYLSGTILATAAYVADAHHHP
jgi:hypothetical protein